MGCQLNTKWSRNRALFRRWKCVKFPIVGSARSRGAPEGTSIAIWTTTPWTLPANLAIAVDPRENYVVQEFSRDRISETLLLAEKLVSQFSAVTQFKPVGEPLAS